MKTKICSKCKIEKDIKYFSVAKKNTGQLQARCKPCKNEYNKTQKGKESHIKYIKSEKGKITRKNNHLKFHYNIGISEYNQLFNKQEGKCLICGRHQENLNKDLAVDHCHKSGKVRGLLCSSCNPKLGWYEFYYDKILLYLIGSLI